MGEIEPKEVSVSCPICGNVEPPFWWLSEEINPTIEAQPYKRAFIFYPSLLSAITAWGQQEGLEDESLVS